MSITVTAKNNQAIVIRKLEPTDINALVAYLQQLSPETKSRFGPHAFDKETVAYFYQNPGMAGFIAEEMASGNIIAYAIIKTGYLQHDSHRLQSYGLQLDGHTDCTFAPSVADAWQGAGIGGHLFAYILGWLRQNNIRRIILWGGVQAGNERAVHYYQNKGFSKLGGFEYNGWNYDMILAIA